MQKNVIKEISNDYSLRHQVNFQKQIAVPIQLFIQNCVLNI